MFAFLPILILSGCGSGHGPLVPAEGRIWLRGQPLSSGTIVFVPDEEKGHLGRMATAVIEPGGAFRLMTDKLPGAEPGWYRVTIASGEGIVGAKMPKKYSDPSKSGVFRQIQAGIPNTLDIQLE
ncbi:MAG: hypothetical protein WCH77_13980 [Planctomycetota bacterium]